MPNLIWSYSLTYDYNLQGVHGHTDQRNRADLGLVCESRKSQWFQFSLSHWVSIFSDPWEATTKYPTRYGPMKQAYVPIEKILRKSRQSPSTSWQCNTSGNRHQPATYGDLCLKWQLKGWHYIISTKKERTSKARSSFGGKIAQGLIHILPILNTYKKVVIMNCSKPLDKGH